VKTIWLSIMMMSVMGIGVSENNYSYWYGKLHHIQCGEVRDETDSDIELIIEALNSTNARVRRLALDKAACLSVVSVPLIHKALSLIHDEDSIVRESACKFMEAHPDACLAGIPHVESLIRTGDTLDRLRGFEVLDRLGEYAVPALIRLAAADKAEVFDRALARLTQHVALTRVVVIEWLNQGDLEAWRTLAAATGNGLELPEGACELVQIRTRDDIELAGFSFPECTPAQDNLEEQS